MISLCFHPRSNFGLQLKRTQKVVPITTPFRNVWVKLDPTRLRPDLNGLAQLDNKFYFFEPDFTHINNLIY